MTNAYTLKDIKLSYQQQSALDITNLTIPAGKITTLLGANGAGKTSLIRLLAFLQVPQQGEISFFNQVINQNRLTQQQRQRIGYVAQSPYLLKGSVLDNIMLGMKLQKIEPEKQITLAQNAIDQTGLSKLQNQACHSLSGGELRQAAIARAIAYQPDILILDEPFSHLDAQNNLLLETIIKDYAQQQNKTIIFSTHNQAQGLSIADNTINLICGSVGATPLVNLFHGKVCDKVFNSGKIKITLAEDKPDAHHLMIDPSEIVISTEPLHSSMQNNFSGRIIAITEASNNIQITVDCGEYFHAMITQQALNTLHLSISNTIWIGFKSTAVDVF